MSWSYDPNNLSTTTSSGRLNTVRLIVGDTETTDQLIQNEEIAFSLSQSNDNVYYAASLVCRLIAAKFSRLVDTSLDNAISAKYSTRAKQYQQLGLRKPLVNPLVFLLVVSLKLTCLLLKKTLIGLFLLSQYISLIT